MFFDTFWSARCLEKRTSSWPHWNASVRAGIKPLAASKWHIRRAVDYEKTSATVCSRKVNRDDVCWHHGSSRCSAALMIFGKIPKLFRFSRNFRFDIVLVVFMTHALGLPPPCRHRIEASLPTTRLSASLLSASTCSIERLLVVICWVFLRKSVREFREQPILASQILN